MPFLQLKTLARKPLRDPEPLCVLTVRMKLNRDKIWHCPKQMHTICEHHRGFGKMPFLPPRAFAITITGRIELDNQIVNHFC
jgi:hypothetical protein